MTVIYDPVEVGRLVEIARQLVAGNADRSSNTVAIDRITLAALANQLEASQREIDHLISRDLFRRSCEWFIATDPEPWRLGRPDFPKCENPANCVGETLPRKSQYILCREHAEQWDGNLVAMSGEAIAIPKKSSVSGQEPANNMAEAVEILADQLEAALRENEELRRAVDKALMLTHIVGANGGMTDKDHQTEAAIRREAGIGR